MSDLPLSDRLDRFLRGTWPGSKRIQGVQGGARVRWIGRVGSELVVWDALILPIRNRDVKRRHG